MKPLVAFVSSYEITIKSQKTSEKKQKKHNCPHNIPVNSHEISIKPVPQQDWGTGAQGQRLGGADVAPNGTNARSAALAAAERRQAPQGVAPERAKEMTEQRQRDPGHRNGYGSIPIDTVY